MVGTNPAPSHGLAKPPLPEFFVSSQAQWSRPVLAAGRLFLREGLCVRIKNLQVQTGGESSDTPSDFP
jgi:hypothetical protein